MNRRNVLLGLGTAAAGSGIVFGSGAFTQVQASRDISVGVSTDGNALVELHPNPDIQSVFQSDSGDNEGELAVNTNQLSSDDKGFNVGSTVQIGATTDPFGDEVDISDPAFEIINRFDDSSDSDDSDFDGTIDVGIDLSSINPSDEEQINGLEFIASQSGSDDGEASSSKLIKAGDRKVFTGLEPASSDTDDDRVAVTIRVETSNTDGTFSIDDAITIQAGSDLTAGDFPNERAAPANTVENQDTEETYSSIQVAVNEANTDDTLFVGPGTYTESVTINVDGLTIEGAGASATTIDAENSSSAVLIEADEVTVQGLHVEGFTELGIADTSDYMDNTVYIKDNEVTGPDSEDVGDATVQGIQISGGDGSEVINNTVEMIPEFDSDEWSSTGILPEGTDNAEIRGNTVNVSDYGIAISTFYDDATGNTIEGNNVTSDTGTGISVQTNALSNESGDNSASDTKIIDNTVDDSSTGLSLRDFGGAGISNTSVSDNVFVDNEVHVTDPDNFVELDTILNDQDNTFDPAGEVSENQISDVS